MRACSWGTDVVMAVVMGTDVECLMHCQRSSCHGHVVQSSFWQMLLVVGVHQGAAFWNGLSLQAELFALDGSPGCSSCFKDK
jgi:hypothetical protein